MIFYVATKELEENSLMDSDRMNRFRHLAAGDVLALEEKNKDYGDSWAKRGGVGAFMNAARKWDRIETMCQERKWDIFQVVQDDRRPEGILDDIQDLRRYLLLIEEFITRDEVDASTPSV